MNGPVEVELLLRLADVRDPFAWGDVEVFPDDLGAGYFLVAGGGLVRSSMFLDTPPVNKTGWRMVARKLWVGGG